jgi:hypothetical protein
MISVSEQRRAFLRKFCVSVAPLLLMAAGNCRAQQDQNPPPLNGRGPKPGDEGAPIPEAARKAALEENDKDIKKKVEKLFQLATELKDEVDKTDSVKVLSLAMLKKADEIEKLAKDIKSRAKG